MKKKLLCILQCILILALVSGCWSRKEPKSMAMVNSVLYDIKDNGESQLVVEIMNPTAETSGRGVSSEKISALTIVCESKTMPEAIRDESKSIDKVLFGGLNKVRLFSEKLSQNGIGAILDYLSRDHLADETPLMVVVQDENPERIYTCMTGLSDMVGNYFDSLSNTQQKSTCESVFVTCLQFMKDYYEDGKQPVMGLVKIVESGTGSSDTAQTSSQGIQNNAQKLHMRYEGLAAFRGDKLVGCMNGTEARAYNMITNDFTTAFVSIPSDNDFTVAMIQKTKSKIKTSTQDEQVKIDVKIEAVLSVIQEGGAIDISKREGIKAVEQRFNKQLKSEIAKSIEKAQSEFKSDIFGFGCFLHAQQPQEWKKTKDNWDDIFSKAKISVTVESSIIREGEIKLPFTLEEKVND